MAKTKGGKSAVIILAVIAAVVFLPSLAHSNRGKEKTPNDGGEVVLKPIQPGGEYLTDNFLPWVEVTPEEVFE